ncbi:MAG: 3-deoxy-manno-octulosonate cytidylyltransferase [Deltaproteobacteria bacterium]|nr:3-deoxy-manno-octulosonate cytidylyltransferase [Deltaproteobacteria bacterium]
MSSAVIIPARFDATRLPGKPLAELGGVPMVERVRRQASLARGIGGVWVATDDPRIAQVIVAGGGAVIRTGPHPSGTDRVAEAAESLSARWILNVQGDMPLLDPTYVEAVLARLQAGAPIATLAWRLSGDPADPSQVKVVCDGAGRALYFSRAPVPHGGPWRVHVGIYGFQREVLREVARLPVHPLERSERLEQLRWLAAGYEIRVDEVPVAVESVDTPAQLQALRERMSR